MFTRPTVPPAPLRVGLVGYGLAGSAFHAPLIAATQGLDLAVVVTSSEQRAASVRERYPDTDIVGDFEDLLTTHHPDLVVVASPNHAHVPQARRALEAGAHVVVDKPVAAASAEARALQRLADSHGLVAAAFHNRRWDSDFLTLRSLLQAGRLGRVRRFESRYEGWSPRATGGWRESGDVRMAPGLLYDLGTHLVDQAMELFGKVARVYAEAEVRRTGVQAPDDVFVALRHEGGELSHLWMSKVAGDLGPRLRVLGSESAFVVWGLDDQVVDNWAASRSTANGSGTTRRATLARGGAVESVPLLPGRYADFYRGVELSIRTGATPPVTLTQAASVLEVIEAAERSAGTAAVVTIGR